MICAITPFLMAHRWRKPVCAAIKGCLRKVMAAAAPPPHFFGWSTDGADGAAEGLGRARVENAPAKLRTATSQFDKCLISFEYPLVSAQKRDPYGCRSAYSAELNVPGRSKTGRYIPRQR